MMFGVVEWHSNRVLRDRLDDGLAGSSRSGVDAQRCLLRPGQEDAAFGTAHQSIVAVAAIQQIVLRVAGEEIVTIPATEDAFPASPQRWPSPVRTDPGDRHHPAPHPAHALDDRGAVRDQGRGEILGQSRVCATAQILAVWPVFLSIQIRTDFLSIPGSTTATCCF